MGFISRVKKIVIVSFFLASYMILKRLLIIKVFGVTYSFAFVPIILCAVIFGIRNTVLVEFLGDMLGWIFFPRESFFIGYTLSAVLAGCIHGFFLYQKDKIIADKKFLIRLIISILCVTVFISLGLNTLWSFYIIGKATKVRFYIKIIRQVTLVPFKIITIYNTVKMLDKRLNSMREV